MNAPLPTRSGWSRGRFLLAAALLFAGQAGWVLLLGERARPPRLPAAPPMLLRLLAAPLDQETWSRDVFAGDPAVFPSSSPHGFANQAWRLLRADDYPAPLLEPPPAFLEFAAAGSGAYLPPAAPGLLQTPFPWDSQSGLPPESAPAFPAVEASRPQSFLRIEGPLAGRQLEPPAVLPSWTNSFLVTNSVVRFAVNRSGQVISAVLLAGSGLKEADDSALATVNLLRFRPLSGNAPELAWDTATLYWKTIPPP
jgi:TonB family protein